MTALQGGRRLPVFYVSFRRAAAPPAYESLPFAHTGRTGRFGRKGLSINFVHNKETWAHMEQIEAATGRKIARIGTDDYDEMEEVSAPMLCSPCRAMTLLDLSFRSN